MIRQVPGWHCPGCGMAYSQGPCYVGVCVEKGVLEALAEMLDAEDRDTPSITTENCLLCGLGEEACMCFDVSGNHKDKH